MAVLPSVEGGVGIYLKPGAERDTYFECLNDGTVLWITSNRSGEIKISEIEASLKKALIRAADDAIAIISSVEPC